MLVRGVPKENVSQIFDNVSFIVFNYDRCIEHFLLFVLQNAYGISDREAGKILVEKLRIIHPYGVVGDICQEARSSADTANGCAALGTV